MLKLLSMETLTTQRSARRLDLFLHARIIAAKVVVVLFGFASIAIGLAADDVFKTYILVAPMYIAVMIAVDRGRSEYALRRGIANSDIFRLKRNFLTSSVVIAIINVVGFVLGNEFLPYLIHLILLVQAIALAGVDIVLKHEIRERDGVASLLIYQLTSAPLTLAGIVIGRIHHNFSGIGLLVLAFAPLLYPLLKWFPAGGKFSEVENSQGQALMPDISVIDFIIKVLPVALYSFLVALSPFSSDFAFGARAYLFSVGLLAIFIAARRNESRHYMLVLSSIIIVLLSFYMLKLIPLLANPPVQAEFGSVVAAILSSNPSAITLSIMLAALTSSVYLWNLRRRDPVPKPFRKY